MQTADESSELSGGIVAWLVALICPEDFAYTSELEFLVRKGAHFTEYFILGTLLSLTVRETKWSRPLWISWVLGTLVACCDETIQIFSAGRAGMVTDVMLDSLGVLTGCVILVLVFRIKHPIK